MAKKSRKIKGQTGGEVSIKFTASNKKDIQAILELFVGRVTSDSDLDRLPVWASLYINNFVEYHNRTEPDAQQITHVQVLREALSLHAAANPRGLKKRDNYEKE